MQTCELTPKQVDRALRLKFDMQTGNSANTFLSTVLLALPLQFTKDIPTAAVSNKRFFINPDFLFDDNWQPEHRVFVMYHEALHLIYRHLEDRGTRDRKLWNLAGDLRINTDLLNMGLPRPPEGIFDDEGKYTNATTDEIYTDIKANGSNNLDSKWLGDILDAEPDNGDEDSDSSGAGKALQVDVDQIIRTAVAVAEMTDNGWGNLPSNLRLSLTAEKAVKVSWRELLAEIPMILAKSAFNHKKYSRRHVARGVYNPLRESKRLGSIHVFYDTSISVTEAQIALMLGETESLIGTLNPHKIYVHCFDTQLSQTQELEEPSDIHEIEIVGRGGTSLFCIERYFEDDPDESSCILIFSDLYCEPLTRELPHPTYWVCLDNPGAHVNFGTLLHYDSQE